MRYDPAKAGRADVNLWDKVAGDAHRRAGIRDVRVDGDGHCCGVWRTHKTRGGEGGAMDAPLAP